VPRLHVICPDGELERRDALDRVTSLLEVGGSSVAVHLRARRLPALRFLELAQALVPRADATGGWIVVNGRTDIARVTGAHAVQLGRGSLPIGAARRILEPHCAVGASVHGTQQGRVASKHGADYLLLGTIFSTPSHPGTPPAGVELIASCAGMGPPVIAIGGIEVTSVDRVMSAGAHGVAVIRAVWESDDPAAATTRLIRAVDSRIEMADGPDRGPVGV
jgi:thiamine-phosphate diphosphorylase